MGTTITRRRASSYASSLEPCPHRPFRLPLVLSSTSAQWIDGTCLKFGRCNRSFCIFCATRTTYRRLKDVLFNTASRSLWRIVLTIPDDSDLSLADQLHVLYPALKGLRETRYWKEAISGGLYNLHVDYNPRGHWWHAHFDLIVEADHVDRAEILRLWCARTGGQKVSVQSVGETEHDRYYLTRYVLKPSFVGLLDNDDLLPEYTLATKNKRRFGRFGAWSNTAAHPNRWADSKMEEEESAPEAEPILDADVIESWEREAAAILLDDLALLEPDEPMGHGVDDEAHPTEAAEPYRPKPMTGPSCMGTPATGHQRARVDERTFLRPSPLGIIEKCQDSLFLPRGRRRGRKRRRKVSSNHYRSRWTLRRLLR